MLKRIRGLRSSTKLFLIAVVFVLYSRIIHEIFPSLWFVFEGGLGFLIVGIIALCNRPKSIRECLDPTCLISGLLLGNAFVFLVEDYLPAGWGWFVIPILIAGATWCAAGLRNFANRREENIVLLPPDEKQLRWVPVMVALFVLAALCLHWSMYFPYKKSMDVDNQLAQINGEIAYSNVHAIGHTILLKALLSLWNDLTVVIIFHLLLLTVLTYCFSRYFTAKGLSFGLQALLFGVFACCANANYAFFYPWKDTPYAVAVGFLSLLVLLFIEEPQRFGWGKAIGLGVAFACIVTLRLNGIIVALFFVPWFIRKLCNSRKFREAALVVLTFATVVVSVNHYAYKVLKADRPDNGFSIQIVGAGIAGALMNDPTEEELEAASEILPVDWIKEHYHKRFLRNLIWDMEDGLDADKFVFNNRFVLALGAHKKEAILLYLKLLPNHLWACFKTLCTSTVPVWGYYGAKSFWFSTITLLIYPFLIRGKKRITRKEWLVFLPALLNILSIAISVITNEERYFLPTLLVYPAFILYMLSNRAQTATACRNPDNTGLHLKSACSRPGLAPVDGRKEPQNKRQFLPEDGKSEH